jgi:hypothetical protein
MLKSSNQYNLKIRKSIFCLLLSEATLCHVADWSNCKTVYESFDSQDALLPVRVQCSEVMYTSNSTTYVHFQQYNFAHLIKHIWQMSKEQHAEENKGSK